MPKKKFNEALEFENVNFFREYRNKHKARSPAMDSPYISWNWGDQALAETALGLNNSAAFPLLPRVSGRRGRDRTQHHLTRLDLDP